MKRYSLHTLVFILFMSFTIVSFIVIFLVTTRYQQETIKTAIEEKIHLAEVISKTISSPIWRFQAELFPAISRTLIEETAKTKDVVFIRIVTLAGTIELSNFREEWGKFISDPDIAKVIKTQEPVVKDEVYKGEKIKTIIYPGYGDKTIWVSFSLKRAKEEARAALIGSISIASGIIIVAFLVFVLILRTIVGPLREMMTACEEVRKGNLEVKIPARSRIEIGELATTFNEMIKDLRESQAALEESKKVLEIKVAARTRQLKELAEQREKIIEEKTKELRERVEELEKFQRLTVGRELKMVELKEEIKKLKEELEKYKKA